MLPVSLSPRKYICKLQDAHTWLVKQSMQLKNEKVGHEVALASCQANFYKHGYVDHLQGRPSGYEFSEKNFETFSISLVDLLDFSFEVAFGRAAEAQVIQVEAAKDELMEALVAERVWLIKAWQSRDQWLRMLPMSSLFV